MGIGGGGDLKLLADLLQLCQHFTCMLLFWAFSRNLWTYLLETQTRNVLLVQELELT